MCSAPVLRADLLQVALEQSFNAVMITNAQRSGVGPVIVYCNAALCEMTGYTEAELLGQSPRILQGPATDTAVLRRLRQCLDDGVFFEGTTVNYRCDGEPYQVEWNISPVRDEAGCIQYFVSVQRDITVRVQTEQERNLLARALHECNDAVLITDDALRIVFVNHAAERLTGYGATELLGQTPMLLRSGLHEPRFYGELEDSLSQGQGFHGTFINRHKSGALYYAEQSIAVLRDAVGAVSHYVGISKDITQHVLREQALREQAHRDQLTGLLNRHAGESELQRCQMNALALGQGFALILGDVDHFKQVNDTWGHGMGDRVLKIVASVLLDTVRSSDHVVRWGGEEFLVILPDVGLEVAQELAERIRSAVQAQPMPEVGHCTLSMGVGVWQLEESADALLHRIDGALYDAKRRGRNQVCVVAHGGGVASASNEQQLQEPLSL